MSRGLQRERAVRDWLRTKCECGCGQDAPVSAKTNAQKGHVAGRSARFISGHNGAKHSRKWIVCDGGYLSDCWLWQRAIDGHGYGSIRVGGRTQKAHRHYYESCYGPIAEGLELDHLCRNRNCVNPDHLEPVSRLENVRRGLGGPCLTSEQIDFLRADSERVRKGRKQRPAGWIESMQEKYGVSRASITKATR